MIWLLLAVFIFPTVFQSLHIHECSNLYVEKEDISDSRHSSDDCAICHFVLPCFTTPLETEFKTFRTFAVYHFLEYDEKSIESYSHHYYLRAPPVI